MFWLPSDRSVSAARFAYALGGGVLPPRHVLTQTCENARCVNPAHQARLRCSSLARWNKFPPGTRPAPKKLTAAQALEIYEAKGKERARTLAERFHCDAVTVYHIWGGRTWAHVTGHSPSKQSKKE